MADVEIRIGSMESIHVYDDVDHDSALETTAPLKAGAPIDPNDVIILGADAPGGVTPVVVADIDNPSAELNALVGAVGSMVLCYELEATSNQHTLYAFDASDTDGENVPYSVDADTSGLWIAVGGKYVDESFNVSGEIVTETRISSGTLTTAVVGPTDNLNVVGVNTVFMDCSANDVTIGGFIGGVDGQLLNVIRL